MFRRCCCSSLSHLQVSTDWWTLFSGRFLSLNVLLPIFTLQESLRNETKTIAALLLTEQIGRTSPGHTSCQLWCHLTHTFMFQNRVWTWAWTNTLALHAADIGMIPGILCSPLSPTKVIPRFRRARSNIWAQLGPNIREQNQTKTIK